MQTETDAADTCHCLSVVLFILSVTAHSQWSAEFCRDGGLVFLILFGVMLRGRGCSCHAAALSHGAFEAFFSLLDGGKSD